MTKFQKKILVWLFALIVCSPIGIFFPELFHTNDAWGEWDLKSIREKTGTVPEGMAKDATMWKAPIPDYKINEDASLFNQSFQYAISGIVGIAFAILITYALTKLLARHEETP